MTDRADEGDSFDLGWLDAEVAAQDARDDLALQLREPRAKIDEYNVQMLRCLAGRQDVSVEIGEIKAQHGVDPFDEKRKEAMINGIVKQGEALGLDPAFVRSILSLYMMKAFVDSKRLETRNRYESATADAVRESNFASTCQAVRPSRN